MRISEVRSRIWIKKSRGVWQRSSILAKNEAPEGNFAPLELVAAGMDPDETRGREAGLLSSIHSARCLSSAALTRPG